MKTLKSAIGTLVTIGVFALPAIASAQVVYNPRHPVSEVHATSGVASGSFAAAAVMGAQGFSAAPVPADFETVITSGCTAKTKSLAGPPIGTGSGPLSVWPSTCNPDGMALYLNAFSPPNPPGQPAVHWITIKTTDQNTAINEIIRGLQLFGSPGIVPIYGQADHWVAITQVTASTAGAILNVRAFDGGKVGGMDSGFNSTYVGLQSWGGVAWKNSFFTVVTAINPSCDGNPGGGCGAPPTSDPFANKYVLMYEPPQTSGLRSSSFANISTFEKSAGIVAKGGMSENVAQIRAFDALTAGGVAKDAAMWNTIKGGSPGQAFRVAGVWPSGAENNYYLVPILSSRNPHEAVGFATLDAEDGSFLTANTLTTPVAFNPVSAARAREIAASQLGMGESLTGGQLTWNPRVETKLSKSPNAPYYEFAVAGDKGATIRVRLNDGAVVRN